MGSVESANHEWIELHNDGEATDVTGWQITDDNKLSISLSGTIPANSYVVLERTNDDSALGRAFSIYTGALVNSGATLSLRNADGTLIDQVVGGENWQNIGGDNVTKETPQLTTSGWVTASPTPGRGLRADEMPDKQNKPANTKTKTIKTGGALAVPIPKEVTKLSLPDVTLKLAIKGPEVSYVHGKVGLTAEPSGIGDTLLNSLVYEWNFGDGSVGKGKKVSHVYDYPGTYVVTVYAHFKRQETVARKEITILPVSMSLTRNTAGDIQVNNDSPYELDLSGYRVRADKEFVFPPRTILLSNQTITIAKQKLGDTADKMIALYDNTGTLAASILPSQLKGLTSQAVPSVPLAERRLGNDGWRPAEFTVNEGEKYIKSGRRASFGFVGSVVVNKDAGLSSIKDEVTNDSPAKVTKTKINETVAADKNKTQNDRTIPANWPYWTLAAVLILATVAVYITPRSASQKEQRTVTQKSTFFDK